MRIDSMDMLVAVRARLALCRELLELSTTWHNHGYIRAFSEKARRLPCGKGVTGGRKGAFGDNKTVRPRVHKVCT